MLNDVNMGIDSYSIICTQKNQICCFCRSLNIATLSSVTAILYATVLEITQSPGVTEVPLAYCESIVM